MHRAKIPSDHHGSLPPIDSSAPIAPRLAPTIPMIRPYVLPESSEKPSGELNHAENDQATQPIVLRLVKMYLVSFA